jgi:hypothetical protein
MDIFTISLLGANALAVIVSKSSRFVVEGVIAASITSAFFKPRVLIVFFIKYAFFLFFSDIITWLQGWFMAIIIPGSPAPLPISKILVWSFVCSRIVSASFMSSSRISCLEFLPTIL